MKIAIFSDNYLPGVGGTENAVVNFALALSGENEVLVIAPDYNQKFDDSVYPYKTVRIFSKAVSKNDSCALPFLDKRCKRILKEFKPDIVHTMTFGPVSSFGINFALKNNIPTVSTVHTKYRFCYRRSTHLKILSEIILRSFARKLNGVDCVYTVSKDMIKELESYGVKKEIKVIKNGGIRRNNTFEKTNNTKFTFLFVGLVVKYKNIKFSLDALKKVKDKGNDFIFNIVGDGQDRKYFEKYVDKIGLNENVRFLGKITDSKILDRIYAQSDLLLFPSVFDNDPLVVCEAGNMGTPSLTVAKTGASERIVDGKNGFISNYSLEDFTNKITELMKDKEKLISAGENAKKLFTTWEQNKKEYLEVYKEVLNKRGK